MNNKQSKELISDPRANADWQDNIQNLHELVPLAKQRLNPNTWGYLTGGSETETALRRNRLAIDELAIRPRMLRDVSAIDSSTSLFGRTLRAPLILAPIGSLESFHPDGAAAVARAAERSEIFMAQSSVSKPELEETAAAAPNAAKIYQLYVKGDKDWVDEQVNRAKNAGFDAFCLTVDVQHYSRRERDIANRFVKPWRATALDDRYLARLNWNDVERFKAKHALPLAIKGIMTVEDAVEAVNLGVEAIWVSNHGGRQLDHTLGSMTVLPEIADAVAGRARIIFDGGVWRGTDVIKAIALGADAVAIGRLTALAIAAGGEESLVRALDLLTDEIMTAMGLMGAPRLDMINADCISPAPATADPRVFSAFPLLDKNTLEGLT